MPCDSGGKPTLPPSETTEAASEPTDAEFITVQEWTPDLTENNWLTGKQVVTLRVVFSEHDEMLFRSHSSGIVNIVGAGGKEFPNPRQSPHEIGGDRLVRAVLLTRCLQHAQSRGVASTADLLRRLQCSIEYMQEIIGLVEEVRGLGFDVIITLPPIR
jgi:hypothetical protein